MKPPVVSLSKVRLTVSIPRSKNCDLVAGADRYSLAAWKVA